MSLIDVTNLTFSYDGTYENIFEDISFHIDTNWKLGFVGRNGRGKTTFLNLLMGKYKYQGKISHNVEFDYFPFNVLDREVMTIDIINFDYQLWELIRELSLLEVSEDILYRPFYTLSNGEQTKFMLAMLFLKQHNFLLIDEPTNHLDLQARDIVGRYLSAKNGFILVSHDRNFLDSCIDHILSINKNNIQIQKGNFSCWLENKQLQDNYELSENEKLKKDISRLTLAAKKASKWSDDVEKTKNGTRNSGLRPDKGFIGHKSAKMMKRSKNIENRKLDATNEKSKLLKNIEITDNLKISPLTFHTNRILAVKDLNIFYENRLVIEKISFEIQQGDRISLSGRNGCGKSTILKLICGEDVKYTGNLTKPNGLVISYVSQDTSHLFGSLEDFIVEHKIDESLFKTILRKFDFSITQFEKEISNFSAGQKKKVLIAKSLCEKAHLYVWDEPLNFIDVLSRMQIEKLLLEYEPTLIFVEHDKIFSQKIFTKQVKL